MQHCHRLKTHGISNKTATDSLRGAGTESPRVSRTGLTPDRSSAALPFRAPAQASHAKNDSRPSSLFADRERPLVAARIISGLMFFASMAWLAVSPSPARAQSATPAAYMDCARSIGVAINSRFAVLPGERGGSRGLYVYTDRGAFFLALGAPQGEDGEANEFFVRTSVAPVGDMYLDYRDRKPGSRANIQPAIGYVTGKPIPGAQARYREVDASSVPDYRAWDALRNRLRERIGTVRNFIDDKNRYSSPTEARMAYELDRIVYSDKLGACRIPGERELNTAVADELQKLNTGVPGLTIWEKQIGATPSLPAPSTPRVVTLAAVEERARTPVASLSDASR